MFESMRKFIDIVFKGLGILFILVVFAMGGIMVKAYMQTMDNMNKTHLERR